jgi:phosphoglycerate kinase
MVIGGSKVSTKSPVIQGLLNQVDTLILTGGLAFAFIKAQGISIGGSLVEDTMVDTAKELLQQAQAKGKTIILPIDAACSKTFPKGDVLLSDTQTFDLVVGGCIPDGFMGLDAGPRHVRCSDKATKIVFDGPAGVFEIKPFDEGPKALVDILEDTTKAGCITVVGGGDSVAALEVFGKTSAVSHVSTGLEPLAGEILPGVAAIADCEQQEPNCHFLKCAVTHLFQMMSREDPQAMSQHCLFCHACIMTHQMLLFCESSSAFVLLDSAWTQFLSPTTHRV